MHILDGGVVKKTYIHVYGNDKINKVEYDLNEPKNNMLDSRYMMAKKYYCCEFQRKSRSLDLLEKFKCNEFRSMLLYVAFYLFVGIVHDDVLNQLMHLT